MYISNETNSAGKNCKTKKKIKNKNTLLRMVVIWFESPRDDATPGSFFISSQISGSERKQYQTTEGRECWVVSIGLGSSP